MEPNFRCVSTVLEIKTAIERLSPIERAELESLIWPQSNQGQAGEDDTPPGAREKLMEAAQGRFFPSDRGNIEKILATLE